jgi:lambda repressor-like predicted transcriptional regulator
MTLRARREEVAFSLAELSQRAGVSISAVLRAELGRARPLPRTRRKLAEALGVQPAEITWPSRQQTGDTQ